MNERTSLKNILSFSFVLAATLPLLFIGFTTHRLLTDSLTSEITTKNLSLAKSLAGEVNAFLTEPLSLLEQVVDVIDRKHLINKGSVNDYLDSVVNNYGFFDMIQVLDRGGEIIFLAPYDSEFIGTNMSNLPFYSSTIRTGKPFWSPTFISMQTGHPTLTLSIPLRKGMLVGYLNLKILGTMTDKLKIGMHGYAIIVDQEGSAISHIKRDYVSERLNLKYMNVVREGLEGREGNFSDHTEDGDMLGSVVIVPETGWLVVFLQKADEAFEPVRRISVLIGAGVLITAIMTIIVSLVSLGKTLKPLGNLIETVKRVAGGDYNSRPQPESYTEIRELADNFNAMIEAVRDREETLQEREERLRCVFEAALNVSFIITDAKDPEPLVIEFSPGAENIFGYSRSEMIGKPVSVLHLPEDVAKFPEAQRRMREGKTGFSGEATLVRKSGEMFPSMFSTYPLIDRNGDMYAALGVSIDISERKQAEEDKASLEAQLLHAQKMEAVGQLAGGVAHDFNNILTAIIGYGSIVKKKVEHDSLLISYMENILTASEKASKLTQSLLAYSRKQKIQPLLFNLNEILQSVEKFLRRLIGEDVELSIVLFPRDIIVMADKNQIEQVLMNLASNARDAMPDGGSLTIKTDSVDISEEYAKTRGYDNPGKYALISIADTGSGMSLETAEKVFEPFFTTKEVGKGTGLGLSMVYGIIRQHDGYIDVFSETGKGTTFQIYLPIVESQAVEVKTAAVAAPKGGTETVLVVEDDITVRELTSAVLKDSGYTVIEAVNGNDAVDKYIENKDRIQLLLLDVIMPGKSGKEVYDEIRKIKPSITVLFISGYSGDMITQKGVFEEGINFISKPVKPDDILRKVREVLDSAK